MKLLTITLLAVAVLGWVPVTRNAILDFFHSEQFSVSTAWASARISSVVNGIVD